MTTWGSSEYTWGDNRISWSGESPVYRGVRTTDPIDLSPVGIYRSSLINWNATVPNNTELVVETSINGGQSWQLAYSGFAIAGLERDQDLEGWSLLVRITMESTELNVTPSVDTLTVSAQPGNLEELVPLATLGIASTEVSDSRENGMSLTVHGYDRSRKVARNRLLNNYIVPMGSNYGDAIHNLIADRLPGTEFDFEEVSFVTPSLVFGSSGDQGGGDPWKYATEMAQSLGMDLYFDEMGVCCLKWDRGNSILVEANEGYYNLPPVSETFDGITVEAWVYWLGSSDGTAVSGIWYAAFDGGPAHFEIRPAGEIRFRVGSYAAGAVAPAGTMPERRWVHVAARHIANSDTFTIYIDGQSVHTETQLSEFSSMTGAHNLGTSSGTTRPFNGMVQELRVWNTRRLNAEVLDNYNKRIDPNSANLVAYYPLDEGQESTVVYDHSGNGYHGTANNEADIKWSTHAQLEDITPTWEYVEGPESMIMYVNKRLSDDDTRNVIMVTGESTSNDEPVKAVAEDDNPDSPTYVNGPYGRVPGFFQSNYIRSQAQAEEMAAAMLRERLGTVETARSINIVNPAHQVGDLVLIRRARSKVDALYRIKNFTIPLDAQEALTLVMRERRI